MGRCVQGGCLGGYVAYYCLECEAGFYDVGTECASCGNDLNGIKNILILTGAVVALVGLGWLLRNRYGKRAGK